MSQVTSLAQLEHQMMHLVKLRDKTIADAERAIARANALFDEQAIPLGRRINKLKHQADKQRKPARPHVKRIEIICLDGLTDEEIRHYQELLGKANHD